MQFFEQDQSFEEKKKSTHSMWIEKYRPSTVDEYIGNPLLRESMQRWIKEQDLPHVMLYGKTPGTGKTSAAKIIVNNIACDSLYINASSENSVDTVRSKIMNFATTVGFNPLKVIILDESEFITIQGQAALRNLLEQFSNTTRVIFTCNYIERIIEPIVSRCQTFHVTPPSKKDVASRALHILNEEKVEFNKEDIVLLLNKYYPDIRTIIGSLQKYNKDGKLIVDKDSLLESSFKLKLIELLKNESNVNKLFTDIRQLIVDANVSDYSEVYRLLYDEVDNVAEGHVANAIIKISEAQYRDALVVDKEINFAHFMIEFLSAIK